MSLHRVFVASLILLAVTLASASLAAAEAVRQDPEDDEYLVGALTWDGARGGISWSGDAPSASPGGPGAANAPDEYVSEPLPRGLHLNASRLIQVDLIVSGLQGKSPGTNACYYANLRLDVEVYVGEDLLGGATYDQYFYNNPGITPHYADLPPDGPNYGTCRYRIQPELVELPAGTSVRLKILHKSASSYQYLMEGEVRSVVRLAYHTPEEVAFRYPTPAQGLVATPAGTPSMIGGFLDALTGAALVAGLAFAGLRSRGRTPVAAACLVLLMAAWAGCIRSPDTTKSVRDEEPGQAIDRPPIEPEYQTGGLSDAGRGTLIGSVFASDLGSPVIGAAVTLLGTANFSRTNDAGQFAFRELEPRTYTVRVDATSYSSFEGSVRVLPDVTTRVDVALVPLDPADSGARAHKHDYWADKREITLLHHHPLGVTSCEATKYAAKVLPCSHTETCSSTSATLLSCERILAFSIPPSETGFHTVLPGTQRVELTMDDGPADCNLWFQANQDPSPHNWTQVYPRPKGTPYRIATAWEMQDAGHQRFSMWNFQFSAVAGSPGNCVGSQPIIVTLKIHKGQVPLEPAHKDFWGDESALRPVDGFQVTTNPAAGTAGHPIRVIGNPADRPAWDLAWLPGGLIPPGTQWMEIFANITKATPVPYAIGLRYKTAMTGASALCVASAGPSNAGRGCDGPDYRHPAPLSSAAGSLRWAFPVDGNESDPYYAKRSLWVVALRPASEPDIAISSADNALTVAMTVIAYRGPMPT